MCHTMHPCAWLRLTAIQYLAGHKWYIVGHQFGYGRFGDALDENDLFRYLVG